MLRLHRRRLLESSALILLDHTVARAGVIYGDAPWWPDAATPPAAVLPGPWHFFTVEEGLTMEAIVDRMIPPDPQTPGGKEAGCVVFIDRQLAGPFGVGATQFKGRPFKKGNELQGAQSALTPAQQYRRALAAIDAHSRGRLPGRVFNQLSDVDKDEIISMLERGEIDIEGVNTKMFFALLLQNVREGFFSDPIYGGNIGMIGWRMIGFPGARYDYSDWIDRHNEPYPNGPISITGAPNWSAR